MLTLDRGFVAGFTGGGVATKIDMCLTEIAPSQLSEHSAWRDRSTWQGMFDIAVWLRTPAGVTQPLQLALCFTDMGGDKAVHIDRCDAGSHRVVLLNASLPIAVQGAIQEAGLYLMGVEPGIVLSLEEWHMTPQSRRITKR